MFKYLSIFSSWNENEKKKKHVSRWKQKYYFLTLIFDVLYYVMFVQLSEKSKVLFKLCMKEPTRSSVQKIILLILLCNMKCSQYKEIYTCFK